MKIQIFAILALLGATPVAQAALTLDEVTEFLRIHHISELSESFVDEIIDDLIKNAAFEREFRAARGEEFLRLYLGERAVNRINEASTSSLELKVYHGFFKHEHDLHPRTDDLFIINKLEDTAIKLAFENPAAFSAYLTTNFDDVLSVEGLERFLRTLSPLQQVKKMVEFVELHPQKHDVQQLFRKFVRARSESPAKHFPAVLEILKQKALLRQAWPSYSLLILLEGVGRRADELSQLSVSQFEKALDSYTAEEKLLYKAIKAGLPHKVIEQLSYAVRSVLPNGTTTPLNYLLSDFEEVLPLTFVTGQADEISQGVLDLIQKRFDMDKPNVGSAVFVKLIRENPGLAKKFAAKYFKTEFASFLSMPIDGIDTELLMDFMYQSLTTTELNQFYSIVENEIVDLTWRLDEVNFKNNQLIYKYAPKGSYFWFEERILRAKKDRDWSPLLDDLNEFLQEPVLTKEDFDSHRRIFRLIKLGEGIPDVTAMRFFRMYFRDMELALKNKLLEPAVVSAYFQTISNRVELRFASIPGFEGSMANSVARVQKLLCNSLSKVQTPQ